jgi:hypothetical protein
MKDVLITSMRVLAWSRPEVAIRADGADKSARTRRTAVRYQSRSLLPRVLLWA